MWTTPYFFYDDWTIKRKDQGIHILKDQGILFQEIIGHFRGIYGIYLKLIKKNWKDHNM